MYGLIGKSLSHSFSKEIHEILHSEAYNLIELDKLDLKYIILDSGNYNPNYKIFSVLDQQPKFDSKVKEGRKIYLTINSSDFKMVEVPNVIRTTIRQARKSLESLGFIIGEIEYIDSGTLAQSIVERKKLI